MVRLVLILAVAWSLLVPETRDFRQRLNFWSSLGGNTQKVSLKFFVDRGFGFTVTNPIKQGEVIIQIPLQISFHGLNPFELTSYIKDLHPSAQLKVRLMYEKFMGEEGSIINEYVHVLPTSPDAPLTWSSEDLNFLQSMEIVDLSDLGKGLIEEYKEVKSILSMIDGLPKQMLEYKTFLWAHIMVETRSFDMTVQRIGELYGLSEQIYTDYLQYGLTSIMIPFIDIVNFYPTMRSQNQGNREYKFSGSPHNLIEVVAGRDFSVKQEFVAEYSQGYSNVDIFKKHGFSIYKMPKDFFVIKAEAEVCFETEEEGICSYRLRVDQVNLYFLEYLRTAMMANYASKIDDPFQYYTQLSDEGTETRAHFVGALWHYRSYTKMFLYKNKDLRDLKRMQGQYIGNKATAIDFLVNSMVSRYQHLKIFDRLYLKVLLAF